jgi:hypothetical protein
MIRKNHFLLFLVIIWLAQVLSICSSVAADSLWSPRNENLFLNDHYFEIDFFDPREYQAATEGRRIELRIAPDSPSIIAIYPNGTLFKGGFLYVDEAGTSWILVETLDGVYVSGWVHADDLQVIYDGISFYQEHESELIPYEGQVTPEIIDDFVFWQYPGSSRINEVWPDHKYPVAYEDINVPYTFIDSDDNIWAYYEVAYRKYAKGWVFYSDPYRTEPVKLQTEVQETETIPETSNGRDGKKLDTSQQDTGKDSLDLINIWKLMDIPLDESDPSTQVMNQYSNLSCTEVHEQEIFCAHGTGLDFDALMDSVDFARIEYNAHTGRYEYAVYVVSYWLNENLRYAKDYLDVLFSYQQMAEFTAIKYEIINADNSEPSCEIVGPLYKVTFQKDDYQCILVGNEPSDRKRGYIHVVCLR